MQKLSQSRAMIDAIGGIRTLLKWESLRADNFVFRLHYKVSFAFLLLCSFIVTAKQYVGDPIDCVTSAAVEKLIDQYCWIHSTFTVTRVDKFGRHTYYASDDDDNSIHFNKKNNVITKLNNLAGLPGSGSSVSKGSSGVVGAAGHGYNPLVDGYPGVHGVGRPGERRLYHRYYQWVCFVLFFQALLFYIPRYIWKICDGGRLKLLVTGLQLHSFNQHMQNIRKEQITQYFISHKGHWGSYAIRFYLCELLNLTNLVGQIFLMDSFLGNAFSTFGLSLLSVTDDDPYQRTDSLAIIFPKVTKCTFNAHGIGGSIVNHDAICVLSVNNINEKIYIFLWFWFMFLLVVSLLGLCYRILTLISWKLRFHLLSINYGSAQVTAHLRAIVYTINSSDWFVLYQISKNINSTLFVGIIRDIDERLGTGKALRNSVTSV